MKLRYSTESYHDLLLKQVKSDSLYERPDCEEWLHEIAAAFRDDLGLLALHSISGLSEQLADQPLVRIPLCAVDNLLLLLVRNAIQARRHLGIALPPGTIMMPMLMICKTLLGDLLAQTEMVGKLEYLPGLKERGGILLVSPDIEMRSRYFSMRVGQETVDKAYPACRMRPDGTIASITSSSLGPPSVCFFLAHLKQLPNPSEVQFKPAVVILDLTHDHWMDRLSDLIGWCKQLHDVRGAPTTVIALLPAGDRSTREALFRHGIPAFPLDAEAIADVVGGFAPIVAPTTSVEKEAYGTWSLSSFALEKPMDRMHTIYYVPNEASTDVEDIVTNIYRAISLNDRHAIIHRDLRIALWLAGTMLQLPLPLQWYEQHAFMARNRQTLKKLISSIGSNPSGTLDRDLAPVLQSVRGQLDLLYMHLSAANPKSEAFLRFYRESLAPILAEHKQVVLLARNDVAARALWPWLQSEGVPMEYQANMRVLTYKQLDGRELFDHMVATGPWPARYRWQIGGRLGRNVDFILYKREEPILKQQVAYFYSGRTRRYLERVRFSILKDYSDLQVIPADGSDPGHKGSYALDEIDQENWHDLQAESEGTATKGSLSWSKETPSDTTGDPTALEPMLSLFTSDSGPDEEVSSEEDLSSIFSIRSLDPGAFTARPALPEPDSVKGERATVSSDVDIVWREEAAMDVDEQPDLIDVDDSADEAPVGGPTELCVRLMLQFVSVGPQKEKAEIKYLYLTSDEATECYMPGQDEALGSVSNDEIQPHYIIIRTDQEDRESLFDHIIHMADAQPTMKYLKVWRTYWLKAIDSLVPKYATGQAVRGSYSHLQVRLAQTGVQVTAMTIRGWVRGACIGPRDKKAIGAIGILTQHPMLLQYPEQIDAAFKQIRVIHQQLGRRITATLQRLGRLAGQSVSSDAMPGLARGAGRGRQEVKVDPALSVPIDDLLDLLEFWEVVEVSEGTYPVPISRVDKLLARPLFG